MNEFELIRRFFAGQPVRRADVVLGIGDDAAVVDVPADHQLVVTTDVLVAGIHFLADVDPAALGHKSLAVNLSDLAAMGAEPAWFTLNLVLPAAEEPWLSAFCRGLYALAQTYDVQLVGGDTSRGPLAVGIAAYGLVPRGQALRRSGARPGDRVYVSGTLGDAALALRHRQGRLRLSANELAVAGARLDWPTPRLGEGRALRGIASSAIDISDGLLADLGHILEASGVGAEIELGRIPLSPGYRSHLGEAGWDDALSFGDDYELCVTARAEQFGQLPAPWRERFVEIGVITGQQDLRVRDERGGLYRPATRGHDHFAH